MSREMTVAEPFKAGVLIDETIRHVQDHLKNPKLPEPARKDFRKKLENLKKLKELKGKRVSSGLTWREVQRVMKVACWGSIAYCCSAKKECPYFFSVCDCLGLDPYHVEKFKEDVVERYLREKVVI